MMLNEKVFRDWIERCGRIHFVQVEDISVDRLLSLFDSDDGEEQVNGGRPCERTKILIENFIVKCCAIIRGCEVDANDILTVILFAQSPSIRFHQVQCTVTHLLANVLNVPLKYISERVFAALLVDGATPFIILPKHLLFTVRLALMLERWVRERRKSFLISPLMNAAILSSLCADDRFREERDWGVYIWTKYVAWLCGGIHSYHAVVAPQHIFFQMYDHLPGLIAKWGVVDAEAFRNVTAIFLDLETDHFIKGERFCALMRSALDGVFNDAFEHNNQQNGEVEMHRVNSMIDVFVSWSTVPLDKEVVSRTEMNFHVDNDLSSIDSESDCENPEEEEQQNIVKQHSSTNIESVMKCNTDDKFDIGKILALKNLEKVKLEPLAHHELYKFLIYVEKINSKAFRKFLRAITTSIQFYPNNKFSTLPFMSSTALCHHQAQHYLTENPRVKSHISTQEILLQSSTDRLLANLTEYHWTNWRTLAHFLEEIEFGIMKHDAVRETLRKERSLTDAMLTPSTITNLATIFLAAEPISKTSSADDTATQKKVRRRFRNYKDNARRKELKRKNEFREYRDELEVRANDFDERAAFLLESMELLEKFCRLNKPLSPIPIPNACMNNENTHSLVRHHIIPFDNDNHKLLLMDDIFFILEPVEDFWRRKTKIKDDVEKSIHVGEEEILQFINAFNVS